MTPKTRAGRLEKYHEQTAPIVPFYANQGLVKTVDGVGSPDEVTAQLWGSSASSAMAETLYTGR